MPPIDQSPATRRRVAVTAVGVVSPLGVGQRATVAALRDGRDAVTPVTRFDVSRCRAKTAGQLPGFWERTDHESPAEQRRWHPASRMLASATREAHEGDPEFQ